MIKVYEKKWNNGHEAQRFIEYGSKTVSMEPTGSQWQPEGMVAYGSPLGRAIQEEIIPFGHEMESTPERVALFIRALGGER